MWLEHRHSMATTIQRVFRGHLARQLAMVMTEELQSEVAAAMAAEVARCSAEAVAAVRIGVRMLCQVFSGDCLAEQ
jgi:hypothetical protein